MKNKIISITFLILFILFFTPNVFAAIDADGNEIIEIEDEVLKENICMMVDYNHDEEISTVEIQKLKSVSIKTGTTNIEPLNYAENLNEIYFTDTTAKDLSILNSLNKTIKNHIGILDLSIFYDNDEKTNNLTDISAVSEFNNLYSLKIFGENIIDITPIQNLTQLTSLSIINTSVSDISFLKNLTNLEFLEIRKCKVTDIKSISNLKNLEILRISYCNIVDIDAISNLSNLFEIKVEYTKTKRIPDLSNLKCTKYEFDNNEIEDISGFINTNCESVNLSHNKINNISLLSEIKYNYSLRFLNLSYNLLDNTCIDTISQLTSLYELELDNNNLSGTVVLNEVKASNIYLKNNPMEEIIIDGNDFLTHINIENNNELKKLSIKNCEKLYDIFACNNPKLEDVIISNIGGVYNGGTIYLENCNISDLSGLSNIANENFEGKIYLDLSNNKIEDISPLASNMFLEKINLINNNVNPYTEQSKAVIYTLAEYGCTKIEFGDCSRFVEGNVLTEEAQKEIVNLEVNGTEVTTIPSVKGTDILDFISKKIVKNDNYDIKIISNNGNKKEEGLIGSRDVVIITDENQNQFSYIVVVPGDVTGNGYVRMYDSFEILKGAVTGNKGLDEIDYLIRDYNQDGNIRMYDAFQYLREAVSGK